MFIPLGSTSRLCAAVPPLTRSLVNRAASRPVPPPRGIENFLPPAPTHELTDTTPRIAGSIATPADFLKAIGRASETKVTVEKWEELWRMSGQDMKKAGLAVRDRRYILWCMEKYRSGLPIESFAHEPRPKKTVRGWGPSVQNGKRIRSRRLKDRK
ncbi:putative IGR [Lyophyllum shimeji]|uniref:Small ribosomal subunit protein mS41 n=1 Tax=Lyophyllum shimeji TaxID=47721 RepID=A0A9P3PL40_LYOSH|nr:putative IGR [Lyophyllum shimeji]